MSTKLKKVLTVVGAFVMTMAFVLAPAASVPVNAESKTQNGITLSKTTTIQDDGTYTIDLEAYATGVTTTEVVTKKVPLDIVLVLDQSGSMAYDFNGNSVSGNTASANAKRRQYAMKNAVNAFINNVALDYDAVEADHRISIVTFGSNATTLKQWETVNASGKDALVGAVNGLPASPSGATNVAAGMNNAKTLVNAQYTGSNPERKKVVIVFTDGIPTTSTEFDYTVADNSIKTAKELKDGGATIYTVGIFNGAIPSQTYGEKWEYLTRDDVPCTGAVDSYWGGSWVANLIGNSNDFSNTEIVNGNRFLNYVSSNFAGAEKQGVTPGSYHPGLAYKIWNVGFLGDGFRIDYAAERTSNQYYLTAADATALSNVFESISSSITSGSTSVTLDSTAVMRDILSDDFTLPEGYNAESSITVKTVAGTADAAGNITWGAETSNPAGIEATANLETNTIDVTGFDYAGKYITAAHPGEKLVVTITGIIPAEDFNGGNSVPTNKATSGIYATADDEIAEIPTATFPVPTANLTEKAYVIDYAKKAELTDRALTATGIYAKPCAATAGSVSLDRTYGTATVENGKVYYQPKTMKWDGSDKFYVFGTRSAAKSWTKMTVVPANNVYYEDSFVTGNDDGVTAGITYNGNWTTVGTAANNGAGVDASSIHGMVSTLVDDTTYSDGTAHEAVYSDNNKTATATFTFKGTGVDVYSKTTSATGTIKATLVGPSTYKVLAVDNVSKSGDYYQVPTLSFTNLAYGEYTVTIKVTNQADSRLIYYLDGIRVYNPAEVTDEIAGIYGEDETNAVFEEARGLLESGAYFVDEDGMEKAYTDVAISELAPQHEIYLAPRQSVTIGVDAAGVYAIGLKAPQGATSAEWSNGTDMYTGNIANSTDMYYTAVPTDGKIVITNTGAKALSITKVKMTGAAAVTTLASGEPEAAVASTKDMGRVTYFAMTEVQEAPVVNEPGDVVITNPIITEVIKINQISKNWVSNLFGGFKSLFGAQ